MPTPKRLHFVCRGGLNIRERTDGLFESGIWQVSSKTARCALEVYLHESRNLPSYRQGKIISHKIEKYDGKDRFIFILQPIEGSMSWEGGGTGEKGYGY